MDRAMDALRRGASEAIEAGCTILILSDRGVGPHHAAIPSLLATAGVHHHLIREGERTKVGIVVESAEPREVAHLALLIGYGAGAVCPYLTLETLEHMCRQGLFPEGMDTAEAVYNYIKGDKQGSAEGDLQDGDLHDTQLPRGSDLRGGRAEPTAGGRVLHVDGFTDRRHRHRHHRDGCAGPPRARLPPGRDRRSARPGPRRVLLLAPRRGIPHVEPGHHREAAIRQQDQRRRRVPRFRGARQRLRAPPLHTAGLTRFQDPGPAHSDSRGRARRRNHQTVRNGRNLPRLHQPRGARIAGNRDEPHRRAQQQRRGRRGLSPLHPRLERRPTAQRHQTGGVGPVRRHDELPGQRVRPADQDGAGGQAGRGRAIAGPQGGRVHRLDTPLHAGCRADLASTPPRHLLHRGPGAADSRLEERQTRAPAST